MSSPGLTGLLRSSLEHLASSPADQLEYVRRLGAGIDELALEFDDVSGTRRQLLLEGEISSTQFDALAEVEQQLTSMTRAGSAHWTEGAVREGEDWEQLRELAQKALATLR